MIGGLFYWCVVVSAGFLKSGLVLSPSFNERESNR